MGAGFVDLQVDEMRNRIFAGDRGFFDLSETERNGVLNGYKLSELDGKGGLWEDMKTVIFGDNKPAFDLSGPMKRDEIRKASGISKDKMDKIIKLEENLIVRDVKTEIVDLTTEQQLADRTTNGASSINFFTKAYYIELKLDVGEKLPAPLSGFQKKYLRDVVMPGQFRGLDTQKIGNYMMVCLVLMVAIGLEFWLFKFLELF